MPADDKCQFRIGHGLSEKTLGLIHTSATLVPVFQALCQEKLSGIETFNIADDSHPCLEEALTLAAATFGGKPPRSHLPIRLLEVLAHLQGLAARLRGGIPDLELDALAYLRDDYVVRNRKLKQSGYRLRYPDFEESMRELGRQQHGDGASVRDRRKPCRSS